MSIRAFDGETFHWFLYISNHLKRKINILKQMILKKSDIKP